MRLFATAIASRRFCLNGAITMSVKTASEIVIPGTLSHFIWDEKYRFKDRDGDPIDNSPDDTFMRVAQAVAQAETGNADERLHWELQFYDAMKDFEFIPAGRIIAGAGTGRDVTLVNCFVMGKIDDSLAGIMDSLKQAAMTMKAGGGIGMDFSSLRPRGAPVVGVDSFSTGAVSFMDLWHSMCGTIMSAGARRGAMMGALRCDHPDIEEFITAKQTAGRLTNFNVSVLVTDAFMAAVDAGAAWQLKFGGKVYKTVKARDLWEQIMRATYEHAEPGVIFIDRVNLKNPLNDIERIAASNPCGEQMLPPFGACVLGSINLAQLVVDPFKPTARLDTARLEHLCRIAVRFLDNVVTISNYPLPEQRTESLLKRRIGVGVTGLADAMIMLGLRYGSAQSVVFTRDTMSNIADLLMKASIDLGSERGAYPAWNNNHGPKRRNSHLMSIAPTGTISCFAGNVSSGIEPVFEYTYNRNVLMPDGSKKLVACVDYASSVAGNDSDGFTEISANVMVTATQLSPAEHIAVAAAAQAYVDSAVSKTINCDPEMTFADFMDVYDEAFVSGMKGCTTYRPSGTRGAVLVKTEEPKRKAEPSPSDNVIRLTEPLQRPEKLHGTTYKIKPGTHHAIYVTINDVEVNGRRHPFEIFFTTKAIECQAWMVALSRMISAVFRKGGDVAFIVEELTSVYDPQGGHWADGKYVPSTAAAIGKLVEHHLADLGLAEAETPAASAPAEAAGQSLYAKRVVCPKCSSGALMRREGCWTCDSCSYSKC